MNGVRIEDWKLYQKLCQQRRVVFDSIDLPSEEGYLVRFATFSANLTNFLPQIPPSDHAHLFKEHLFQVALETHDRTLPNISDFCDFLGNVSLVTSRSQPFIFCAFHLGSYRALAAWLIELGYDFSILVRQEVYDQQLAEIQEHDRLIKSLRASSSEVQVINAEDPTSLVKILRQLRAGRSLLVYMDGNTGTGTHKDALTTLLHQPIFAKQGAAFLSYASGVCMLPIFAYRRTDYRNIIVVESPIEPDKTISKERFSQQTTQYLYDRLGDYIAQYPTQWEAWGYIHHQLHLLPVSSNTTSEYSFQKIHYTFNQERFSLFLLKDSAVIFDRRQYLAYEISPDLYEYLSVLDFEHPRQILGDDVFEELVMSEILQ